MPLLTMDFGFNSWYLSQLPEDIRTKAIAHLKDIEEKIKALNITKEEAQYYIPM
ncbi:MAG: hypothetical protein LBQ24_00375 [Candidatus Peribacteria bacterium]|jgi:type VI protein secretion system component VasF|nr:hypothetical protein [Candidatus Peribacteria bacterium]